MLDRNILAITLGADEDSQTQLFVVPAFTFIPDHIHPDVDVVVNMVMGKAELRKNKERLIVEGSAGGRAYNIRAGEVHGFSTYGDPVVFVARQRWLNGKRPSSIEENWVGETLGPNHRVYD